MPSILQKATSCSIKDELRKDGKITFGNVTSFTTKITSGHKEFGDCILTVNKKRLCKQYKCVEISYTLEFMKKHPSICKKVTACKGYKQLAEHYKETYPDSASGMTKEEIDESIENEIEELYGWESEVIVKGNPVVIKKDDILSIKKF